MERGGLASLRRRRVTAGKSIERNVWVLGGELEGRRREHGIGSDGKVAAGGAHDGVVV
jgi:hypothetical protein